MLNSIEAQFTIRDLENLSGIKAHTIRIWEQRYKLLEPHRTDSNIRYYNIENLKKLLNVSLLYGMGYKISKIASLADQDLKAEVKSQATKGGSMLGYSDSLVLAMLDFDQGLFEHTFNRLVAEFSFRQVFLEVFVPFLHKIGLHWQSDSITPAHEHFVSNLIKQKLHLSIERVQQSVPTETDRVFVLFLPDLEIHELGLLYIHYELLLKGYQSIYLGQSVPMDNLGAVQPLFERVTYVSYFTVQPAADDVKDYLAEFSAEILSRPGDLLWVTGRNTKKLDGPQMGKQIKLFNNIDEIVNKI